MSASADVITHSRWRPRRPQPRGEERRRRLLEALEGQLQLHRFGEVSIADVADAAGLGRSAFYFYFSSKHDAVTQLLGDVFEEEIASVGEILYGSGDAEDNITDALAFIVDSWRQRRTLLCAMLDARDGDEEARLIWNHWLGRYEQFACDYITTTTPMEPAESRALAHVLIAMNERALEHHIRGDGDHQSADDLHRALVRVWHATLRKTP